MDNLFPFSKNVLSNQNPIFYTDMDKTLKFIDLSKPVQGKKNRNFIRNRRLLIERREFKSLTFTQKKVDF